MPTYEYECQNGHPFERVLPHSEYRTAQYCNCGSLGKRIITAPTVFASKAICYDSPIDGRPITSRRARIDDLARNNCVEYDPEIKKDYARRIERQQASLDKSIEATVEETIERMPIRKRELLEAEFKGGADCVPERKTAPFTTITKVKHGN